MILKNLYKFHLNENEFLKVQVTIFFVSYKYTVNSENK